MRESGQPKATMLKRDVREARGDLMVEDISLSFGGIQALDRVSLRARPGLVTGIIGPNGAGKSSLLNCVNGLYRAQSGRILLDGQEITGLRPHQVARSGVSRTFQHIELSPDATALESVLLGRHIHSQTFMIEDILWWGRGRSTELEQRGYVEGVMHEFGLLEFRDTAVSALPFGTQKLIDLARAVTVEPALLLLDEPSSGMTQEEKKVVAGQIQRLRDERSLTQVVIEHDTGFIADVCDHLVVLDYGRVIAQGEPRSVLREDVVVKAYIGAALDE